MNTVKDLNLPLIVYAGPFSTWFVFYMIGVYISRNNFSITIGKGVFLVLLGLLLEFVETYYLYSCYGGGVGIKLSSYVYSVGVILLLFNPQVQALYKENRITSVVAYIGRISFGIYLIHMFVVILVNKLSDIQFWIIDWSLVLIITIVTIKVLKTIFPNKYIQKYLGIL